MKETINFVFNENEVPNRATAHSLTTGEKQIVSKDLVLEKLTSLKKDFSNVSCRTRKGEVSSTFVFKYKKNNQELLARVILNNNDPFYESVSNLSELYKVNKKYKKLKTLAIASGIVLVTTAPIVQKNITNFTNKVISDDNKKYTETLENDIKGKKLFYFKEACDINLYKDTNDSELLETLKQFHENIEKLRKIGFSVTEVEFGKDLLDALYPTYMTISCAEATSNNANLTGIQFGPRGEGNSIEEIMFDARTKGFSELIKRRFILGSYILQKENQEKLFLNAGRIRRLVVNKMNELFKTYDGLIMPTSGGIAPKFGQKSDQLSDRYLILENHLVIGNFGGFPSISLPSGFVNNMPISINLTGKAMEDDKVLNMAYKIEECLGYKGLVKEEYDV